MRFNDACQEAAVCRETQLASFCKLLDTHVSLVRDDQLRRCHGGQFSLQAGDAACSLEHKHHTQT